LFYRRPFVAKSVLTKNYPVESILPGSVREASAAPPALGDRPSDEGRTWVPASGSAQQKEAELPGVGFSQREMVGRTSAAGGRTRPAGALGSSTATVNRGRANATQKSL
jgi:hypothetical protein